MRAMSDCKPTRKRNTQMEPDESRDKGALSSSNSLRADSTLIANTCSNQNHLRQLRKSTDCERSQRISFREKKKMKSINKSNNNNCLQNKQGMFKVITSFILTLNVVVQLTSAAMSLPGGIENILGFVPRSTFQCERDGYFGDIDNDCRIFHLCQKHIGSNGRTEWRHWTYACGNQTMFNQLTLTCAFVDEAIPCKHASQFQYLNEVIHKPREPFLTDADVTSGVSYYSNRIMSDGARNRAFEDSRLMAQLGGQEMFNSVQASFNHNKIVRHKQQPQHQQPQPRQAFPSADQFSGSAEEEEEEQNPRRAGNLIEEPVAAPPQHSAAKAGNLIEAFERAASFDPRQQDGFNHQPSGTGSSDLVINHHQHFQHNAPSQFERATRQHFDTQPRQNLFSGELQLPVRPAPTGGPHSFDFSISTNHQLGAAANEPEQRAPTPLFRPQQPPQPEQPVGTSGGEESASATPPSTSTLVNRFAANTLTPPVDLSTPAQQVGFGTTPSSAVSQQATTTTTQRTLEPPTTFNSATTTTTTTSTTTASATTSRVAAPTTTQASQLRRRQSSQAREQLQQDAQRNQTAPAANQRVRQQRQHQQNQLLFEHMHTNFQSTRLSAAQRRPQPESALVMRRQVQALEQPGTSAAGPAPTTSTTAAASAAFEASQAGGFWRRPFGAQLLAPKFESLLTRRRV